MVFIYIRINIFHIKTLHLWFSNAQFDGIYQHFQNINSYKNLTNVLFFRTVMILFEYMFI